MKCKIDLIIRDRFEKNTYFRLLKSSILTLKQITFSRDFSFWIWTNKGIVWSKITKRINWQRDYASSCIMIVTMHFSIIQNLKRKGKIKITWRLKWTGQEKPEPQQLSFSCGFGSSIWRHFQPNFGGYCCTIWRLFEFSSEVWG